MEPSNPKTKKPRGLKGRFRHGELERRFRGNLTRPFELQRGTLKSVTNSRGASLAKLRALYRKALDPSLGPMFKKDQVVFPEPFVGFALLENIPGFNGNKPIIDDDLDLDLDLEEESKFIEEGKLKGMQRIFTEIEDGKFDVDALTEKFRPFLEPLSKDIESATDKEMLELKALLESNPENFRAIVTTFSDAKIADVFIDDIEGYFEFSVDVELQKGFILTLEKNLGKITPGKAREYFKRRAVYEQEGGVQWNDVIEEIIGKEKSKQLLDEMETFKPKS